MSQKIVISKLGIDPGTVANPNDMIFSSDYDTLKYSTNGSIVVTVVTPEYDFYTKYGTVAHNLDYYPFHQVWVKDSNFSYWSPTGAFRAGGGDYHNDFVHMGKNNMVVRVDGYAEAIGTFTVTFAYKIFKNNLNL